MMLWWKSVAQTVKNLPVMWETQVRFPGTGRSPGEGNGNPLPVFLTGKSHGRRSLGGYTVHGVSKSWTQLRDFTFTFHFHALEKEMATHSSVLAWRIPGTGEPGRLLSMGSHRVRHDWSDLAAAAAAAASSKNFHQETKLLLKTFFIYNSSSYWSGNY